MRPILSLVFIDQAQIIMACPWSQCNTQLQDLQISVSANALQKQPSTPLVVAYEDIFR